MDLNLFGIGPLELVFFVVLLLLLFGPKDLAQMARNIGRFINRLVRSENYRAIHQASQELRNIPERLIQEAQLDEMRSAMTDAAAAAQPARPPARPQPAAPQALSAWTQELPAAPPPPASGDSAPPPPAPAFAAWTRDLSGDPPGPDPRPR
jgi:Sec-independent protein translocase protein TatA